MLIDLSLPLPGFSMNQIIYLGIGIMAALASIVLARSTFGGKDRKQSADLKQDKPGLIMDDSESTTVDLSEANQEMAVETEGEPEAEFLRVRLTSVDDPDIAAEAALDNYVSIGSSVQDNVLIFDQDMIASPKSCNLLLINRKVYIKTIRSGADVFVNGKKVKEEERLHNQDVIRLGKLSLRFEILL